MVEHPPSKYWLVELSSINERHGGHGLLSSIYGPPKGRLDTPNVGTLRNILRNSEEFLGDEPPSRLLLTSPRFKGLFHILL